MIIYSWAEIKNKNLSKEKIEEINKKVKEDIEKFSSFLGDDGYLIWRRIK
ncbi:MAG: hypothetical protein LC122_13765 [Chitinophagales bacterium]|nr:hypothetical protein [Chitinophagales bacterium]